MRLQLISARFQGYHVVECSQFHGCHEKRHMAGRVAVRVCLVWVILLPFLRWL